jgi:uncharacterized protein (DUF1786 family)
MQAVAGTIQLAIVVIGLVVGLGLVVWIWQLRITRTDKAAVTSSDEYRRLSELAVTSQEHTDMKLAEINMQLVQLRDQLDTVHKILKDVE